MIRAKPRKNKAGIGAGGSPAGVDACDIVDYDRLLFSHRRGEFMEMEADC